METFYVIGCALLIVVVMGIALFGMQRKHPGPQQDEGEDGERIPQAPINGAPHGAKEKPARGSFRSKMLLTMRIPRPRRKPDRRRRKNISK